MPAELMKRHDHVCQGTHKGVVCQLLPHGGQQQQQQHAAAIHQYKMCPAQFNGFIVIHSHYTIT